MDKVLHVIHQTLDLLLPDRLLVRLKCILLFQGLLLRHPCLERWLLLFFEFLLIEGLVLLEGKLGREGLLLVFTDTVAIVLSYCLRLFGRLSGSYSNKLPQSRDLYYILELGKSIAKIDFIRGDAP